MVSDLPREFSRVRLFLRWLDERAWGTRVGANL